MGTKETIRLNGHTVYYMTGDYILEVSGVCGANARRRNLSGRRFPCDGVESEDRGLLKSA